MQTDRFLKELEDNFFNALEIVRDKNKDYAKESDPFHNFRFAQLLGLGVEEAILVRMSDKLARISNLIDQEAQVKDESIGDTLMDLANYANILKVYMDYGRQQEEEK